MNMIDHKGTKTQRSVKVKTYARGLGGNNLDTRYTQQAFVVQKVFK